jgi:hypothetical protein
VDEMQMTSCRLDPFDFDFTIDDSNRVEKAAAEPAAKKAAAAQQKAAKKAAAKQKAAKAAARPTAFSSLSATPQGSDASSEASARGGKRPSVPACGGSGASSDGVSEQWWHTSDEKLEAAEMRRRNGVEYAPAARRKGAIVAETRTGEGYQLPSGKKQTCLVDATYNAIMACDPSLGPSLPKMRSGAIPELGNELQATWASTNATLSKLEYPFKLVEATAQFKVEGGPMLNVLKASNAVLVVGLHVVIDGKASEHAVMVSTLCEPHAPYGKMIDNHGKMKPVYIEAKDHENKRAAAEPRLQP